MKQFALTCELDLASTAGRTDAVLAGVAEVLYSGTLVMPALVVDLTAREHTQAVGEWLPLSVPVSLSSSLALNDVAYPQFFRRFKLFWRNNGAFPVEWVRPAVRFDAAG